MGNYLYDIITYGFSPDMMYMMYVLLPARQLPIKAAYFWLQAANVSFGHEH